MLVTLQLGLSMDEAHYLKLLSDSSKTVYPLKQPYVIAYFPSPSSRSAFLC